MNVLTASVSGEDISDPASDRKIAKVLGLKPRRLFGMLQFVFSLKIVSNETNMFLVKSSFS
jgi:hypothetical protein